MISIVVPFPGAARETGVWAEEEAAIDFRGDPQRAGRCTASFAATELRSHLLGCLPEGTGIVFCERDPGQGPVIVLEIEDVNRFGESFVLVPLARGVLIRGRGRLGLTFGAYEFLRLQGWRWYAPGKDGACAPARMDAPQWPTATLIGQPGFANVRGFDIEQPSRESAELVLWMARNRLNLVGDRPGIRALARKLGLQLQAGGHIFERALDPDRPMPSGRSLWEDHQEWFGLPASGTRSKALAQRTQFNVVDSGLQDFLAAGLLDQLNGPWREADIIYVWGFDTWGEGCRCPGCQALGNGTDQILHLFSCLRTRLDAARANGRLDHDVRLGMCAYEGTASLDAPTGAVPANLLRSGDYAVFYPINRCYDHAFADRACAINARYHQALAAQLATAGQLPFCVGEYWNVSKFDDLPLVFTQRISEDLRTYQQLGVTGMTYMHVPLLAWAVRTATQGLYAQLAWAPSSDTHAWMAEFCDRWYGPHAAAMAEVLATLEQAFAAIADWRAWSQRSILSELLSWDGRSPSGPLAGKTHFATPSAAIAAGHATAQQVRSVLTTLDRLLQHERARHSDDDRIERRLAEDRRAVIWGLDCSELMTACVVYHEALRANVPAVSDAAWAVVEDIAERLERYVVPMTYKPLPGVECPDALQRSQLRAVVRRCRRARSNP